MKAGKLKAAQGFPELWGGCGAEQRGGCASFQGTSGTAAALSLNLTCLGGFGDALTTCGTLCSALFEFLS